MFLSFFEERKNETGRSMYLLYNNELYNVISTCGMPAVRFQILNTYVLKQTSKNISKLFTILVVFAENYVEIAKPFTIIINGINMDS